jgi:hypothetical protein
MNSLKEKSPNVSWRAARNPNPTLSSCEAEMDGMVVMEGQGPEEFQGETGLTERKE